MCTVSMIGDHYRDLWRDEKPWVQPSIVYQQLPPEVTKAEFDELKKEVMNLKKLLTRAKKYDADNGEPDCEIDDKMEFLRKVAKLVGVDLDEALKPASGA